MKKISSIFVLFLLLGMQFSFAQEEASKAKGMEFFEGSWEEVLAAAKKQNKPIFLDAYTSWCGPCKYMSKNIFTTEEAGDFYNKNYINVKFDMEKGDGLTIAEKYAVKNYPTYLFFDADGNVVHRALGKKPVEKFLADGANGLDENKQYYTLKNKYEESDDKASSDLLHNFALAAASIGDRASAAKAADAYIGMQKETDLTGKNVMDFVMKTAFDTKGKAFNTLVANKKAFETEYGADKVTSKIGSVLKFETYAAAKAENMGAFKEVLAFVNKNMPEQAEGMTADLSMVYHQTTKNWDEYALSAVEMMEKMPPTNWNVYNSIAWTFYEKINDENLLKKAVKWTEKSMEMETNYYNTDTYAALLYKIGETDKAIAAAEKAIKIAVESGMDPKETKALLEQMDSL